MEQAEEIGIKIYNAAPPEEPSPYPSSPQLAVPETHRKRRVVAKGVQKTLSKTSMLVNFLPTGTLLTFEMVLPSVSGNGQCSPVSTMMIHVLMGLCALSCFFFHFTDSYKGPDEKVYYGFVTPKGLAVFKPGLGLEIPKEERFKVGFTDFVHALMSVMVFLAIAFSDHRITDCLFPRHVKELDFYQLWLQDPFTPRAPWGLQLMLQYVKDNYKNPAVMIHENGRPHNQDRTSSRML